MAELTDKTTLRGRMRALGAKETERERRLSAAVAEAGVTRLYEVTRWLAITAMVAFLVLAFIGPRWAQGAAVTTALIALIALDALGRWAVRKVRVLQQGPPR